MVHFTVVCLVTWPLSANEAGVASTQRPGHYAQKCKMNYSTSVVSGTASKPVLRLNLLSPTKPHPYLLTFLLYTDFINFSSSIPIESNGYFML